jgi:hypothetical protein
VGDGLRALQAPQRRSGKGPPTARFLSHPFRFGCFQTVEFFEFE